MSYSTPVCQTHVPFRHLQFLCFSDSQYTRTIPDTLKFVFACCDKLGKGWTGVGGGGSVTIVDRGALFVRNKRVAARGTRVLSNVE
jgi:hypothetical protein